MNLNHNDAIQPQRTSKIDEYQRPLAMRFSQYEFVRAVQRIAQRSEGKQGHNRVLGLNRPVAESEQRHSSF